MAEFPALPLWTDAYLADLHPRLTLEEHGCMILLMQFAWRSPDCRLVDDNKKLARMLGVSAAKWRKLRPVMEEIWTVKDKFWSQKRLTKEFEFVTGRREKYAERARRGGEGKALKDKETGPLEAETSSAEAEPEQDASGAKEGVTHNPQPTPTLKKEKKDLSDERSKESSGALELVPPKGLDRTGFVAWWKLYPRKVGKKAAERNYLTILRKREATAEELQAGLHRSIAHWNAEGTETKFIIHPERWLSKGHWKDDLTTRKRASTYDIVKARALNGARDGDDGTGAVDGAGEADQPGPPALQSG